jgi:hypothetical protein
LNVQYPILNVQYPISKDSTKNKVYKVIAGGTMLLRFSEEGIRLYGSTKKTWSV